MADKPDLPPALAKFVEPYYEQSFGEMPPLPAARLELSAAIDPEAAELAEWSRVSALYSGVIDEKTAQMLAFAFLASRASAGAYWHAKAARRHGATWQELHKVLEIAAFFTGVPALNEGGQALVKLAREEVALG